MITYLICLEIIRNKLKYSLIWGFGVLGFWGFGVYIAGGIVPRFKDYIKNSGFRERFETKGRMSHLNKQTPTYIITESQPGLMGAAAYLNQVC